jgi:hypothetical protein
LAHLIVPQDRREEFVGDLLEEWHVRHEPSGDDRGASFWFSRQLLKSMPALFGRRLAGANPMLKIILPLATVLGLFFCYVDTRPTWDDTGVMAFAIAISCAVFAAVDPRYPWLWTLAVGLWIPLVEIVVWRGFGSLLALVFAFGGAYFGSLCRRLLVPAA